MTEITAVFEVNASHVVDITADVDGRTPGEIAELLYGEDPGVSLCHACATGITAESGDLVSFTVDGVTYEPDGNGWKVVEGLDSQVVSS